MKANKLSATDRELFHQAMRLVQPLVGNNKKNIAIPKNKSTQNLAAKRANAETAKTTTVYADTGLINNANSFFDSDTTEYTQAGYGRDLNRGLKRGKWPIQAQIDLHGYNKDQAQQELDRFLAHCLDARLRCIRIIHGKGIGSASGQAVLKHATRHHLSRLKSVLAWIQAKPQDGGSGAVIALLKLPK